MKKVYLIGIIFISLLFGSTFAQNVDSKIQTESSTQNEWMEKYTVADFGENVFIFNQQMDMQQIQDLIDSLYHQLHSRSSEFGDKRIALLFAPGTYHLDIKVGYYMSILGLGETPDDVLIIGSLISKGEKNGNVTCNFWRSVENITIESQTGEMNIWGVSQASPMRRVHIKGDIQLHDNGWASGGFIADSKIDGTVYAGGQQQWFTRNTDIGKWNQGNWNIMFMGVSNTPEANWPDNPYTVINETPVIREKPYLVKRGSEFLIKLPILRNNSSGIGWTENNINQTELPLLNFYIAKENSANAETINTALAEGKNIFFCPGIYVLDQSLKVNRPGTILAGIGMATLRSGNGNSVIEVSDVSGVTISGLIIDAGKKKSETLVKVGEINSNNNHEVNPTFLHDIFIRVGGYGEGSTSSCMVINSNNVVVDHTWLWRADHGMHVGWDQNVTKNGLIVNGNNVTVYGLFCEHFHEYQTLWNGNDGRVYFYQSEMPYDPPSPEAYRHGTTNGFASYKVSNQVTNHEAWALGIYCVFFKAPVIVDQAIETPAHIENSIHHKIIYWLYGGNKESKIMSVINGKGGSVNVNNVKTAMD